MNEKTGHPTGDWFQTWTGQKLYITAPNPAGIVIEDIAHALARQCRYNGHVNVLHYSVAQHSILVASIVPKELRLAGLLHDAAEAYLGDCIRPLKSQLPYYQVLELLWERAISQAFGLEYHLTDPEVKRADEVLLATERRDLWQPETRSLEWPYLEKPMVTKIKPWNVGFSELTFLSRFREYSQ